MIDLATIMAMVRGLHLAAALSLLGTVGFIAWMLPGAGETPERLCRRLTRLWWISGVVALLAGMAWFAIQSAVIAGAETWSDGLDALPVVAMHTRYGNTLMVRLGLLLVATVLAGGGSSSKPCGSGADEGVDGGPAPAMTRGGHFVLYLALFLVVFALGLQGLIGHAGATGGAIGQGLVLSEALHLLAAGVWLGALLPLWLGLRGLTPVQAAAVCERFSPIGLACVLVLAGTGFAQGLELIGSLPALFGTPYGHVALLKITLFLLALVLAALNRLWLTDRLAAGVVAARRELELSICVEVCVGIAIVTAAAFMASSPPAAHTTPVWPFSWQYSLVTVNEDPDFRREVILSLVAIGIGVVLMAAALVWRRFRLVALAVLALALVLRGPSLKLLTVEAYPTSFQTSPTDFSAASIARGQVVFARTCVACHGVDGEGDGPAAVSLHIKPADLTMPHLWEHTDGELFWWLTHGIDDPEGGLAMPGFAASLPVDDRWAAIDYIRAHNAGWAMLQDQAFDAPVRAPAFPIRCAGPTASNVGDLHGHAIHVVTDQAAADDIPPQSGIATVTLNLRDSGTPAPGTCIAASPSAWQAYAVLTDVPPEDLAGAEFLVDPNGWLRAVHRPGMAGGWHTAASLVAAIRGIDANPIQPFNGGQHEHHH
jgi:putative copper export protein/mono/diheme cytochrome c family protein